MVLLCWLVNMTGAVTTVELGMGRPNKPSFHCLNWGTKGPVGKRGGKRYTYIRGIRHHPASTVFQFSFDSQNPRGFDPQDGFMGMAKDSSLNRCLKVKSMLNEFLLKKLTWFICLVTMVEINASTANALGSWILQVSINSSIDAVENRYC